MSAADPRAVQFLTAIKADGRSSPAGIHWHRFYEFLQAKKRMSPTKLPLPLILAASGESNGSKHRRLASQLEWAIENNCLDDAIHYLEGMPRDQWNTGSLDQWEQDHY
ncbi:MAG: hypothetical protein HY675_14005 [Chloroflexi bacterium]|nr:hypothetical protein [Chloroflexota bacterium]